MHSRCKCIFKSVVNRVQGTFPIHMNCKKRASPSCNPCNVVIAPMHAGRRKIFFSLWVINLRRFRWSLVNLNQVESSIIIKTMQFAFVSAILRCVSRGGNYEIDVAGVSDKKSNQRLKISLRLTNLITINECFQFIVYSAERNSPQSQRHIPQRESDCHYGPERGRQVNSSERAFGLQTERRQRRSLREWKNQRLEWVAELTRRRQTWFIKTRRTARLIIFLSLSRVRRWIQKIHDVHYSRRSASTLVDCSREYEDCGWFKVGEFGEQHGEEQKGE